jgi:hypothetical protein
MQVNVGAINSDEDRTENQLTTLHPLIGLSVREHLWQRLRSHAARATLDHPMEMIGMPRNGSQAEWEHVEV